MLCRRSRVTSMHGRSRGWLKPMRLVEQSMKIPLMLEGTLLAILITGQ